MCFGNFVFFLLINCLFLSFAHFPVGEFFCFFFLIGLKKTLHALRPWGFSLQRVFFKFVICLLIFIFLMHEYVYASVWSNIPILSPMFYFLLLCLEKLPLLWYQINISLYFSVILVGLFTTNVIHFGIWYGVDLYYSPNTKPVVQRLFIKWHSFSTALNYMIYNIVNNY